MTIRRTPLLSRCGCAEPVDVRDFRPSFSLESFAFPMLRKGRPLRLKRIPSNCFITSFKCRRFFYVDRYNTYIVYLYTCFYNRKLLQWYRALPICRRTSKRGSRRKNVTLFTYKSVRFIRAPLESEISIGDLLKPDVNFYSANLCREIGSNTFL